MTKNRINWVFKELEHYSDLLTDEMESFINSVKDFYNNKKYLTKKQYEVLENMLDNVKIQDEIDCGTDYEFWKD